MTREEIMKMEGDVLNSRVAEYVMLLGQYEHKWEADGECEKCRCIIDFHSGHIFLNNKIVGDRGCINPDPYSADISAAWEVDKPEWKWGFEESNLGLYVCLYPSQDKAIAVFVPWDGKDKQSAYCLGRCRAALLAVMG